MRRHRIIAHAVVQRAIQQQNKTYATKKQDMRQKTKTCHKQTRQRQQHHSMARFSRQNSSLEQMQPEDVRGARS
eukprot:4676132-Pyramimonas_sp.AAC.1